ncbi:unnamed protein product [Dovyalis caffra]|uniref:Uncharacterized protein n=1 Tax=Dovyalis caffra TaxID=77055 RepID=A0AAV1SG56_9ROSI|nr:unnamed protein product [Dovyalis caffra]
MAIEISIKSQIKDLILRTFGSSTSKARHTSLIPSSSVTSNAMKGDEESVALKAIEFRSSIRRVGVPMEVMSLMLGEFVDEYIARIVDCNERTEVRGEADAITRRSGNNDVAKQDRKMEGGKETRWSGRRGLNAEIIFCIDPLTQHKTSPNGMNSSDPQPSTSASKINTSVGADEASSNKAHQFSVLLHSFLKECSINYALA